MMNIIRADIHRILKGKGFYITLAVLVVVIILFAVSGAVMNFGNVSINADRADAADFSFSIDDLIEPPMGIEAHTQAMAATHSLFYFMIALISFISLADFASGAVKNTLASGVARVKYYFAKLILSCGIYVLLMLVYVLLSIFLAAAFNGFGGNPDGAYIAEVVKIFFSQLWLGIAAVCVAHFFAFLLRSAAFVGVYIAFLLVPTLILSTLMSIHAWFANLADFELTLAVQSLVNINLMSTGDIMKALLIGAGYIIAAVAGGYALFKRAEIK